MSRRLWFPDDPRRARKALPPLSSFGTLRAHYEPSDATVTRDGSNLVSAWADLAEPADAANKAAVQATVANQPTYIASDARYNGRPTIFFPVGGSKYLRTGTWASALAMPCTWVIVADQAIPYSTNYTIIDGINGTNRHLIRPTLNSGNNRILMGSSGGSMLLTTDINAPSVIVARYAGNSSSALNVNSRAAGVTGSAGTNTLTGLSVGIDRSNASPASGLTIALIATFSGVLSDVTVRDIFTRHVNPKFRIWV